MQAWFETHAKDLHEAMKTEKGATKEAIANLEKLTKVKLSPQISCLWETSDGGIFLYETYKTLNIEEIVNF